MKNLNYIAPVIGLKYLTAECFTASVISFSLLLIIALSALAFGALFPAAACAAEVIGHRGAAFYAPENTLSSIKTALAMGVDGVEIDVHLTKDKKIAVIHDKDTKRISGGKYDFNICEKTYDELKHIDAGSHKAPEFKDEKIPLLEEVLALMPEDKKLFIEIKCGAEIFEVLPAQLENIKRPESIVIISFSLDVAALSKVLMPRFESYWILGSKFFAGAKIEDAIKIALASNLDGLDTDHKLASADFIKKVKSAGLKYYVWTLDEPRRAAVLKLYGLDGITSNKPDVIIEAIKKL
jgi:glycerophosphoryl diester phosphodiesterase